MKAPSGALWLHEIKHDGFRVIARNDGARGELQPSGQRPIVEARIISG
jgi:hypothetical protein